jgi:hypothetical protein
MTHAQFDLHDRRRKVIGVDGLNVRIANELAHGNHINSSCYAIFPDAVQALTLCQVCAAEPACLRVVRGINMKAKYVPTYRWV